MDWIALFSSCTSCITFTCLFLLILGYPILSLNYCNLAVSSFYSAPPFPHFFLSGSFKKQAYGTCAQVPKNRKWCETLCILPICPMKVHCVHRPWLARLIQRHKTCKDTKNLPSMYLHSTIAYHLCKAELLYIHTIPVLRWWFSSPVLQPGASAVEDPKKSKKMLVAGGSVAE